MRGINSVLGNTLNMYRT
ncbi:Protein of unknown function [Pyronema omphalodes CBS 100304]|uniref:Uncharacterized protein n=1 Tax=Pyronema omphalodes (strain CBS 100304) TaxID=1076935 RepID=U4LE32_PYROM|nr:Protein of unknown function [Pyronema omphalodes CBS 100304]